MNRKKICLTIVAVLMIVAAGCSSLNNNGNGALVASGTISALKVNVAPEIGGVVSSVKAQEGDPIEAGDELFRIDDTLLQGQLEQALAAVELSEATLDTAETQLEAVKIQYELVLQGARLQESQIDYLSLEGKQPEEYTLPAWYFQKSEVISALEAEVEAAKEELEEAITALEDLLLDATYSDFIATEENLAQAREAFIIAQDVYEEALKTKDDKLIDVAERQLDAAKAELEAAQLEYDKLLSSSDSEKILEARARVVIAQNLYDTAVERLSVYLSGEESLTVEAALASVKLAESAVTQAEAGLKQANAALAVLEIQLEKTIVRSPISGNVLIRNIEAGEVVGPGSTVFVIGVLDEVELTVYLPEDRYGEVLLGQEVEVSVDSFPGQIFPGKIVHIADEAEFTPRNVQTTEGRKSTVFAIKIIVPNPDLRLKPGMPADVTFNNP